MRLQRFEIRNFKGIQEAVFEWENIITLIGENNSGKSTILQALQCFLSGTQVKDEALSFDNISDEVHAIELVGHFDELTALEVDSVAVKGRLHDGRWIIKKRFWSEEGGDPGTKAWKEAYSSFSSDEALEGWPSPDNSWVAFPPAYQDLIATIPDRGPRPNATAREQLRELAREQKPELVTHTDPAWVPNPGGGGNWKSNANSIIPRLILVKAVHEAADEAESKDASAYGKIVGLIVERKLMLRPEVAALKEQIRAVLALFRPDPNHPESQAEEIRELETRINSRLNEIIGGIVTIETAPSDLRAILLPNTSLIIKDKPGGVSTSVEHQGHGLQRTLIMTLLQLWAELQEVPTAELGEGIAAAPPRAVILAIEEPELYMHPQMERKMRDSLFRLASQPFVQVISTTHSPVFLDMAQRHRSIVRVVKDADRHVRVFQVLSDLFEGADADSEHDRLRLIATFHPVVNEVFFAKRVVFLEEETTLAAFERGAELLGIFERHPAVRRDVTLVDCRGKQNIPMFQQVLNHFEIPFTVIHDEDHGNPVEAPRNARIAALLAAPHGQNRRHMIAPTNIEGLLGYTAGRDKPYRALKKVEELHAAGGLPAAFLEAITWAYFGDATEPPTAIG
jgi:putative ATP-dependent endonuclease of OLD family